MRKEQEAGSLLLQNSLHRSAGVSPAISQYICCSLAFTTLQISRRDGAPGQNWFCSNLGRFPLLGCSVTEAQHVGKNPESPGNSRRELAKPCIACIDVMAFTMLRVQHPSILGFVSRVIP